MIPETLKWIGGVDGELELIDQRVLPGRFEKLRCGSPEELFEAIQTLAVRGAPAIGVAAAYGVVLGLGQRGSGDVDKTCDYLAGSRPTAVNLFWALERMRGVAKGFAGGKAGLRERLLEEAHAIGREDAEMCRRIGVNGEHIIKEGAGVLTHCNAGALATAGQGTALSVMFEAHKLGRKFTAYCDETRPLLQGARLTAWELGQAGVETVVICDNMAGWLMRKGRIDAVITGADRIAGNGDAANKIGTYSLSVLARHHGIPFYIAAPSSTFDLSLESGDGIVIEERAGGEVTGFGGVRTAPEGVGVCNPAFDVTPAGHITGIITERGVIERPDAGKVARHFE